LSESFVLLFLELLKKTATEQNNVIFFSFIKRYRERLNGKYEKKSSLLASSWTFIKDGIDDFRNGVIPKLDSTMVIKVSGIITCNKCNQKNIFS